jgi:hypothetical protein
MKYNVDLLLQPIPKLIEDLVFKIFEKEVEFFRQLEHERHKFVVKFGNQTKNLFNQIDEYGTGKIIYEYLEKFFRITDYIITKEEY